MLTAITAITGAWPPAGIGGVDGECWPGASRPISSEVNSTDLPPHSVGALVGRGRGDILAATGECGTCRQRIEAMLI